jgi:hypothetical protein
MARIGRKSLRRNSTFLDKARKPEKLLAVYITLCKMREKLENGTLILS